MATAYETVEIWVAVDESGEFGVGRDAESAEQNYQDDIGNGAETGRRFVKLTVKVPLPTVIEIAGEVAVSEESGELKAV